MNLSTIAIGPPHCGQVQGRIRKTLWLARDRASFVEERKRNVTRLVARARKMGVKPAIRLNGISDLPWLARELAPAFPEVQFYDYTKHPKPWLRTLPNYHLPFSHSGHNIDDCLDALHNGINVAVVFTTSRSEALARNVESIPGYRWRLARLQVLGSHGRGSGTAREGSS